MHKGESSTVLIVMLKYVLKITFIKNLPWTRDQDTQNPASFPSGVRSGHLSLLLLVVKTLDWGWSWRARILELYRFGFKFRFWHLCYASVSMWLVSESSCRFLTGKIDLVISFCGGLVVVTEQRATTVINVIRRVSQVMLDNESLG